MRNSEVLFKASNIIATEGWVCGSSGWKGGGEGYCLEGALIKAAGIDVNQRTEYVLGDLFATGAYNALCNFLGVGIGFAWRWNDGLDRGLPHPVPKTTEEVVGLLRAAAISEKVKEINADLDNVAALRAQVDEAYAEVAVTELESVA